MASIEFYFNKSTAGETDTSNHIPVADSGIGFYGSDHGVAVAVGSQQSTTFLTDKLTGSIKGDQLSNTAWASSTGVYLNNGSSPLLLSALPNYQCPLNIRFEHTEDVAVQNCKLRIFNRSDINTSAKGVTTYVFEARHPNTTQNNTFSLYQRAENIENGTYEWTEFLGYDPDAGDTTDESGGTELLLTSSPGAYGKNESESVSQNSELNVTSYEGPAHRSSQHDWYIAISSEPESVGNKNEYGLYFTAEYL